MEPRTPPRHLQRLKEISRDLGVFFPDDFTRLSPPTQIPSFRSSGDESKADAALALWRENETVRQHQPKGIKRAFAIHKRQSAYTYQELYGALTGIIDRNGSSGVAEILLGRFKSLGGDPNLARRGSTSSFWKLTKTESQSQRGRLLQTATGKGRLDFVQLLAPHADPSSLDDSLPIALDTKHSQIIEILLRYGANASLCLDQFRKSARIADTKILALLLRAPNRPSPQAVTEELVNATINGSLGTVSLLAQAGANGDYGRASALRHAVENGLVKLATAIVISKNPPSPTALNQAIDAIFSAATGHPQDNHLLTEVLLCGGAIGNAANEGLFKATMMVDVEMMQLLLEYGADINYNNAFAIGYAIQRNRVDLVRILLQNQNLNPKLASEAVARISRTAPSEIKVAILSMLLVHGATGPHCNELLIVASETDDIETARLLLSFGKDQSAPPVASVDYNAARCLKVAASKGNHMIVDILTAEGRPSKFSLGKAFPVISPKNSQSRFLTVRSLLKAGAEGDEVDTALANALSSRPPSILFIELLVRNGAKVDGPALINAVSFGQPDIVQILLDGRPSALACSTAIPVAVKLHNSSNRLKIVSLLIPHAIADSEKHIAVAQAIIDVLEKFPGDIDLLGLLCQQSKANMNFRAGKAVILAIQHANPLVLDFVLAGTSLTDEVIGKVLPCALKLPLTDPQRERKVEAILRRTRKQPALDDALIKEIRQVMSVKGDLAVVQKLLSAGADVNATNGAPVCFAVDDAKIMDLLLTNRPTPHTLSMAFPVAMTLGDPARYDLCEKLLKAGAAGEEISKALIVAVKEGRPAMAVVQLLLPRADVNHNEGRVFRLVIRRNFSEGLDLLLTQHPNMPSTLTKTRAFQEAMSIKSREDRYGMIRKLLATGIRDDTISDALITAVNHTDLPLAELLLQSGASTDRAGGQAVLAAASSGDGEILSLLVLGNRSPKPTLSTLTTGFGGATALRERDREAYFLVLKILLEAGLKGEVVNAALVDEVAVGDANLSIVELIYSNGASVEWQDGEAVDVAVQIGSLKTLSMLLVARPSQSVLKRAYRSSLALPRSQRCSVIDMVMKAGKTVDSHVTLSLLRATQETPADRELIKLLLDYGVFDEGQAAAYAATILDLETLNLYLESPKSRMFITSIFQGAASTQVLWQSERGLSVMEAMLENGAEGDPVGEALLMAVENEDNRKHSSTGSYLDLFLRFSPDINYGRGIVLQRAVQHGSADLIERLLPRANPDSKSMAFPYLLKSSCKEKSILRIIETFRLSTSEGRDLDFDFKHPDPEIEPLLFMVLRMFPRKAQVLKALLDTGVNPDQSMPFEADRDTGPESFSILCWAIYQPEKKISTANIAIIINAGANVSFSTKSLTNPVLLAVKNQRPDVLEILIAKGAKVSVSDDMGVSPLSLASQLGNSPIITLLSKAGAEVDDGSLHDAARELRCDAMKVLIKEGHEIDYPSPRHDGRSALAELCYKAVDNGPSPDLEEAIRYLIVNKADHRMKFARGKSVFHYALDSCDPITILKALLKPLWKDINDDCYLFTDGHYTYSLTTYVEKGDSLGPAAQNEEVMELLLKFRVDDRFWANSINAVQPDDCRKPPQYIADEMKRSETREKQRAEIREDFQVQVEMKQYLAIEERKILHAKTADEIQLELDKARAQELITENRADQQLRIESSTEQKRLEFSRVRQEDEINHIKAVARSKLKMDQEKYKVEEEHQGTRLLIENKALRTRLAIEQAALEDEDGVLAKRREGELRTLTARESLLSKTQALANSMRTAGVAQREIGYVMGEL